MLVEIVQLIKSIIGTPWDPRSSCKTVVSCEGGIDDARRAPALAVILKSKWECRGRSTARETILRGISRCAVMDGKRVGQKCKPESEMLKLCIW